MAGDPLNTDEEFLYGDPDDDWILNWEELILGTDPYNGDSDNDGLPDFWEYQIAQMDPADAGDAHLDYDYYPTTFHTIGEKEALFSEIKKDIDVWPANREITFAEPWIGEDGPHYDNYEEYYRSYRDKNDGMKIKLMSTLPQNPDSDGDGILDPDDEVPTILTDGVSLDDIELSNGDTTSKNNNEQYQISTLDNQDSIELGSNHNIEQSDFENTANYVAITIKPIVLNSDLKDIDNDGI
jgi:hypothetical protein